ncbi:MAG: S1 RNA-binding domain-containing protein [Oscillospiraceae bacterium]|nr:S1 RNA-binding domain-containing protein [Oscillospiraceae bacterium]
MDLEVGSILDGKVTGITKFGAFVALPDRKSGLVHISEIANSYVSDVHDFVQMGQTVRVKVLSIGPDGKINLSIKRAAEEATAESRPAQRAADRPRPVSETPAAPAQAPLAEPGKDQDFEARLKKFMQESDSRIADNRRYADHKQRNRRR